MNTCPQCHSVYGDDFVYCLNDGTILARDAGEQETVIQPRVDRGFGFAAAATAPAFEPAPAETVTVPPGLFAPPQHHAHPSPRPSPLKPVLYTAAGVLALLILVAVGVGLMIGNNARGSSGTGKDKPKTEPKSVASFTDRRYTGTVTDPKGRTNDLRMDLTRSGRNLNGFAYTFNTDELSGTIEDDNSFKLTGLDQKKGGVATGYWSGTLSSDGSTINGTWTDLNGGKASSFSLRLE